MKQKLSSQTVSFIFLASACLFGGFLVVLISSQALKSNYIYTTDFNPAPSNNTPTYLVETAKASDEMVLPDISKWPSYHSPLYGIKFKFPPTWQIGLPKKFGEFQTIEIDPGKQFYNIVIYISQKDYYVMDGLPSENISIGGQPALNISNLLYGMQFNGYYFTFDLGRSLSLAPEFNALVQSIEFIK